MIHRSYLNLMNLIEGFMSMLRRVCIAVLDAQSRNYQNYPVLATVY